MTTQGWVHVGRQPIYDRELNLHGYELLFRETAEDETASSRGDLATTKVIVHTFTEFGVSYLVGDRLAFVNLTRPFLVGDLPMPLPADSTVLEILETVKVDDRVVEGVIALRAQGYVFALDDFEVGSPAERLLPYVQYVKIDIAGRPGADLQVAVDRARAVGAMVVAERVEVLEDMETCSRLGVDFLQGFLLARPDVVSSTALAPSQVTCLQLVAKIAEPSLNFDDLEHLVKTDVALTYRMLRAANSAASGSRRRIASVRDALVMLGLRQLRSWLLLMLVGDVTSASEAELSAALTRARTCELLAPKVPTVSIDSAFIAGMLSSLGDLLGRPLEELTQQLPLDPELRAAVVDHTGPLGELLAAVIAYDTGDLLQLDTGVLDLDSFEMSRAYLSAVGWSLQTCESVLATD